MSYCIEAGVKGIICFGFGVTLREGNREYFYSKLDDHFPGLKQTYMSKYGLSYNLESDNHGNLMARFIELCKQHNIMHNPNEVFQYLHEFPETKSR